MYKQLRPIARVVLNTKFARTSENVVYNGEICILVKLKSVIDEHFGIETECGRACRADILPAKIRAEAKGTQRRSALSAIKRGINITTNALTIESSHGGSVAHVVDAVKGGAGRRFAVTRRTILI